MKISPVGYQPYSTYNIQLDNPITHASNETVKIMSKEDMQKLMDLITYNQFGMAEKLARMASQMYAGMNFDYSA
ncbi:MAG: hypothetical protein PWQ48_671 [Thermotogaceae bacterium]|jgi:hypothetical protein|nr:hypothetical protein [Thermotogaceae bacterium]